MKKKKKQGLYINFETFDRDYYIRDMMKDPDKWLAQQRLSGVVSLIFIIGIVSLILLIAGRIDSALLCIAVGVIALPFFFINC
jgi:nicotinamide riboside transporter PnuC